MPAATNKAAASILKFFLENFDNEGYEPQTSFVPWAQRKYQVNHKKLNDTGYLRSQFRVERVTNSQVVITNKAPYAEYINNGTNDTAPRPILYQSKELEQELEAMIRAEFANLFKF